MEELKIKARWLAHPMTLGNSAELIKKYMKGLQEIHPVFRLWISLGDKSFENVLPDLSDICHHVFKKHISRAENSQNSPSADENTLDALGFTNSFFTFDAESKDKLRPNRKGGVELTFLGIGAYSHHCPSSVSLSLPTDVYGELHAPEIARKLLEWTVKVWQPTCGYVISHDFVEAYQGEFRMRELYAGWMTYVRFPPLLNCLPVSLPCQHEVIADDASLFILCTERASMESHDHLDRARRLQGIFEDLYLCDSKYVLNGWPMDSLEIDYKMQISQAPSGIAYLVKMVYFDGYDAERDVLIYATLLRPVDSVSLKPDNYDREKFPERASHYDINSNPYVIEARRQISSVNMTGRITSIEWHIGLKENIEHLQSIFTIANIEKSRLNIQYTPFSGKINEPEI